jgi:hypothetical protein
LSVVMQSGHVVDLKRGVGYQSALLYGKMLLLAISHPHGHW